MIAVVLFCFDEAEKYISIVYYFSTLMALAVKIVPRGRQLAEYPS